MVTPIGSLFSLSLDTSTSPSMGQRGNLLIRRSIEHPSTIKIRQRDREKG